MARPQGATGGFRRGELRQVAFEVYSTAKGQCALYVVDRPDWQPWGSNPAMSTDPRTWSEDFLRTHDRSLTVFPTMEELVQALPDDLRDAAMRAVQGPVVRDLDI